MKTIRMLIQFLQKGSSQRAITKQLSLSRNTIRHYIENINNSTTPLSDMHKLDDNALSAIVYADSRQMQPDQRREDFEQRIDYLLTELKRTGVTKQLLWEEYHKELPHGYRYSAFCELLVRHQAIQGATMHFTYTPADMMMVDFAGDMLSYVDKESGQVLSCPVFVVVLPYSGYSFAIALHNATQPNVIKALNLSLAYFGGVPRQVKFDNMKQAVSKSCRYEPVFTDTLQQWALHNNIGLLAARPRKPKDKAPVENQVKLTYQRIYAPLRDQVYFSLESLNKAILEQLSIHHRRAFQKKPYSRLDSFEQEEKPLLQPLPPEGYYIRHGSSAKVQKNYHITLGEDWHHYSVPFSFIGKQVTIVYDEGIVEVYHEHRRIALHPRSYKKHGYTTLKEHMPESHQRYSEQRGWNEAYFLSQAKLIGEHTFQYIQAVLRGKHFAEQTYNGCLGILRLSKTYGTGRLEAACKRGLTGNSFNYRTISNILAHHLDTLEPIDAPPLFNMPDHDNLRGPDAYN